MIIKERKKPIHLQKLEALARRLPINHPKALQIQSDLAKYKAGYQGEKALDFHLSFVDKNRWHILHDLRLSDGTHHFQIDTLLLSPNFLLLLEVKNISGTLIFDTSLKQLIRKQKDSLEGFPDPVTQVKRQKRQLTSWFSEQHIIAPPIEYFIVISNPSTIIEIKPPTSNLNVIHAASIPERVTLLEKHYKDDKLNKKDIRKIIRLLMKKDIPCEREILNEYKISVNEIQIGVHCPNCFFIPMKRIYGKWYCRSCNHYTLNAHENSLNDYFLLINETINNKQFRDFFKIDSRYVAKNLLLNLNLESWGTKKGKVYYRRLN